MRQFVANKDEELAVFEDSVESKPYGWVLYVNSKRYLETRDFLDMLVGLGPVVVRHSGRVDVLSSAAAPEHSIAAFERRHWWLRFWP